MGNAPRRNGFAARHVVAAVAFLTGSWLAHPPAHATETIVVHSAAVVTWGEIVEAGARGLRSAPGRSTPRVAPVPVPPPEPREIGAPLISPPPGVALEALLARTMGTAQGLAVSTGFLGTTCCSTTCRLPDTDGDGVCDHLDPCPHLANTTPQPLVRAPRVTLHYRPNGPGGQDDGLRVANVSSRHPHPLTSIRPRPCTCGSTMRARAEPSSGLNSLPADSGCNPTPARGAGST